VCDVAHGSDRLLLAALGVQLVHHAIVEVLNL
jgi:hypothetical protein